MNRLPSSSKLWMGFFLLLLKKYSHESKATLIREPNVYALFHNAQ